MEPISLAVGVAALAGLFETAIDGFRYVRAGREFGTDFQTSCLQLDNAQLRLSRWGEAVGLGLQTAAAATLETTTVPKEDIKRAEERLGHIVALFQQAETVTNDFRARTGSQDATEIDTIMSPATRTLHERMLKICRQRQRDTSAGKKAQWALFGKDHFKSLVADVDALVRDLVELFPATVPAQKILCNQEAEEFRDVEALATLKEVAEEHDALLAKALAKLAEHSVCRLTVQYRPSSSVHGLTTQATTHNTWNNRDNTKVLNQIAGDQNLHGGQTFTL